MYSYMEKIQPVTIYGNIIMNELKKNCKENKIESLEPNTKILEDQELIRSWNQTESK